MAAETTGQKQRGRPFRQGESGNPKGRPLGSRNKATEAALALLGGEASALTRKAVELALAGDTTALRLCLERIAPPRKDAPVQVQLPDIRTAADLPAAIAALLQAVAAGEVTPNEGERLARLVGEAGRAIDLAEIEERLSALEAKR